MMIKCKKQFIALFMAISVIFCVGSQSYIKAEALEWAVPTITAGEAIKWLLGLLGVTVAGGALANTDYNQLVENYNDFAEIKGQTAVETGKFWADIIDGTLDQGSKAWANFKEWVSSLFVSTSFVSVQNLYNDFCNSSFPLVNSQYMDFSIDKSYNYEIVGALLFKSSSGYAKEIDLFLNDATLNYNYTDFNETKHTYLYLNSLPCIRIILNSYNEYELRSFNKNSSFSDTYSKTSDIIENNVFVLNKDFFIDNLKNNNFLHPEESISFLTNYFNNMAQFVVDGVGSSAFQAYDSSLLNTLSLILSNAISDAIPDVIPLPWDKVSDTAEGINDKIDELIEKVNEGVISLEDYMTAVQAILGVLAFNPANDLVIPINPALPDLTIQDKINENVNNNEFVLTGLEKFFPFCIPFDIYSFITILVAEPVAPVIHWNIYNPVTKSNNIMTLDFSVWEPIVILFRYIFDFLFIIGLALIARSLIGGDD